MVGQELLLWRPDGGGVDQRRVQLHTGAQAALEPWAGLSLEHETGA